MQLPLQLGATYCFLQLKFYATCLMQTKANCCHMCHLQLKNSEKN